MIKTCVICNSAFNATGSHKVCSDECRLKNRRARKKKDKELWRIRYPERYAMAVKKYNSSQNAKNARRLYYQKLRQEGRVRKPVVRSPESIARRLKWSAEYKKTYRRLNRDRIQEYTAEWKRRQRREDRELQMSLNLLSARTAIEEMLS